MRAHLITHLIQNARRTNDVHSTNVHKDPNPGRCLMILVGSYGSPQSQGNATAPKTGIPKIAGRWK